MRDLLLVAAGGALGACGRYGLSLAAARLGALGFPWSTLATNLIGGLAMGLLVAFAEGRRPLMLLLGVGLLGGFTTFSAFSIETVRMIERGDAATAMLYVGVSVAGAIGAAYLGLSLGRALA
jgi:CrcB protein